MARPKGSRNKPKQNGEAKSAEPAIGIKDAAAEAQSSTSEADAAPVNPRCAPGDNSSTEMPDDQRHVLTKQWAEKLENIEARKDSIVSDIRNMRKNIKAELGPDGVDDVKLFIKLRSPEGEEAAKADMERRIRVMRWLGVPLGTQAELFPAVDLRPSDEVAYEAGKRAGLEGEPCRNPHDNSVPQHKAWMDGWYEGQKVLVETKLRPMPVQEQPKTAGDAGAAADDDGDVRPRFMKNNNPEESARQRRQEHAVDEALAGMAKEQAQQIGTEEPTYSEA